MTAASSATTTSVGVRMGERSAVERVGVDGPVVEIDRQEDLVGDRVAQFLGELPDESGGAREQGEAAEQLQGQAQVGERGAADPGAVERQRLAEHLRVHLADR